MTRKGSTHRVLPSGGNWKVQRDGASRASGVFDTKREAVSAARHISQNQRTELAIHGENGRIQSRDSHGGDPHPPKG